jgi:hypothetical protein
MRRLWRRVLEMLGLRESEREILRRRLAELKRQ